KGLFSGVANLLPANKDLPITKLVDALMGARETAETERFQYFDPKSARHKGPVPAVDSKSRVTAPFRDACVFVLGGGNFAEYHVRGRRPLCPSSPALSLPLTLRLSLACAVAYRFAEFAGVRSQELHCDSHANNWSVERTTG